MVLNIPDVTLNNGKKMPVLGLGTYGVSIYMPLYSDNLTIANNL